MFSCSRFFKPSFDAKIIIWRCFNVIHEIEKYKYWSINKPKIREWGERVPNRSKSKESSQSQESSKHSRDISAIQKDEGKQWLF